MQLAWKFKFEISPQKKILKKIGRWAALSESNGNERVHRRRTGPKVSIFPDQSSQVCRALMADGASPIDKSGLKRKKGQSSSSRMRTSDALKPTEHL